MNWYQVSLLVYVFSIVHHVSAQDPSPDSPTDNNATYDENILAEKLSTNLTKNKQDTNSNDLSTYSESNSKYNKQLEVDISSKETQAEITQKSVNTSTFEELETGKVEGKSKVNNGVIKGNSSKDNETEILKYTEKGELSERPDITEKDRIPNGITDMTSLKMEKNNKKPVTDNKEDDDTHSDVFNTSSEETHAESTKKSVNTSTFEELETGKVENKSKVNKGNIEDNGSKYGETKELDYKEKGEVPASEIITEKDRIQSANNKKYVTDNDTTNHDDKRDDDTESDDDNNNDNDDDIDDDNDDGIDEEDSDGNDYDHYNLCIGTDCDDEDHGHDNDDEDNDDEDNDDEDNDDEDNDDYGSDDDSIGDDDYSDDYGDGTVDDDCSSEAGDADDHDHYNHCLGGDCDDSDDNDDDNCITYPGSDSASGSSSECDPVLIRDFNNEYRRLFDNSLHILTINEPKFINIFGPKNGFREKRNQVTFEKGWLGTDTIPKSLTPLILERSSDIQKKVVIGSVNFVIPRANFGYKFHLMTPMCNHLITGLAFSNKYNYPIKLLFTVRRDRNKCLVDGPKLKSLKDNMYTKHIYEMHYKIITPPQCSIFKNVIISAADNLLTHLTKHVFHPALKTTIEKYLMSPSFNNSMDYLSVRGTNLCEMLIEHAYCLNN